MLWSLSHTEGEWLATDLLYLAGIAITVYAVVSYWRSQLECFHWLGLGWILFLTSFLQRFTRVLATSVGELENDKITALCRTIVQTLALPLLLSVLIGLIGCFRDKYRTQRTRWMLVTLTVLTLVMCCVLGGTALRYMNVCYNSYHVEKLHRYFP